MVTKAYARSASLPARNVAQSTHDNLAAVAADSNVTGMHPASVRALVDNGYITITATLTDKGRAALALPPLKRRSRKASDFGLGSDAGSLDDAWRTPPTTDTEDA